MTKPKRVNGDGSVYKQVEQRTRPDGSTREIVRWRAVVSMDNGTRKYITGPNRSDVLKKLREAQRAVERGVNLTVKVMTVAQWCEHWLASRRTIEATTREKDETCLRLHIKPSRIGNVKLTKLTAEQIDDWLADLEKGGLGAARRHTILTFLRAALKAADARGYLSRGNVALHAEMPKPPKRRREAPNADRVAQLLATTQDNPRLHAFVLLCLGGGLRRGEVLGLTWGAVEMETGRLTVRARVNRIAGQIVVREGAKSDAGELTTYVASFVTDTLRQLRTHVREARLAEGPLWQGEDDPASAVAQVFVTSHGTVWGPEDAHKEFKRACVRAGLEPKPDRADGAEKGKRSDLTFHGLRHDFASLLARLGVPLKVAMEMLGHSHELMTIYYQHASHDDRREAADKVGDWLRRAAAGV